jgi:hypothetical protein
MMSPNTSGMCCPRNTDREGLSLAAQHTAEPRKHVRFSVKALAIFSRERAGVGNLTNEGLTRDVSVNGAFVFSTNCPPASAMVRMKIIFPQISVWQAC